LSVIAREVIDLPDFQQMLQWSAAHPALLLAVGFLLAFIEALALVGIVVPGILLLFMLGALVGWDLSLLSMVTLAVMAGAVAGDGLSFWLGRLNRGRLHERWPFVRRSHWLDRGEQFFVRHGGKSIFIARFIGPLRPVVPLVAGSLGMPPATFVPRMLVACALWAPLMLLPGAIFGESLALAAEFGGRLTLLLLVLVVGGWLLIWLTRSVYEATARRSPWWLKNLALWLRRHPLLGRWFGGLVEPGRREVLSVVALGLLLVVSLTALFGALLLAPLSTTAWESGFELSGLAASLRSHFTDPLFFVVAMGVSRPVLLALIALVTVMLLVQRRWNALLHWLLATLGGWLLALMLNALMGFVLDRPHLPGSVGEVPHVDFVLAVLVVGFAALIVAKDFRPRQRKWLYLTGVALLALIAFSQFYLARATVNGLAAALALAMGWLALTGIGYRSRATPYAYPGWRLAGFLVGWLLMSLAFIPQQYSEFARQHQLEQPTRQLDAASWWADQWQSLPELRSRIGGDDRQRFDAQFAMERDTLESALAANGWTKAPGPSLESLRALFGDSPAPRRLFHLRRDFAGQPDDLIWRRLLDDGRTVLLRAWDSGARLEPGDKPVWLAQVRLLEPVRRLGLFNTWREIEESAGTAIDRLRGIDADWHWRRPDAASPWLVRRAADAAAGGTQPH